MLFKTLKKLIEKQGLTEDLKEKIDILFVANRLTQEEYNELMGVKQ